MTCFQEITRFGVIDRARTEYGGVISMEVNLKMPEKTSKARFLSIGAYILSNTEMYAIDIYNMGYREVVQLCRSDSSVKN